MRFPLRLTTLLSAAVFPLVALSSAPVTKAPIAGIGESLKKHNQLERRKDAAIDLLKGLDLGEADPIGLEKVESAAARALRPYAEYEPAGTLFFSAEVHFNSRVPKETMLRELPSGTSAVVYVHNQGQVAQIESWVHSAAPQASVQVIPIPRHGQHFWSRDALPIPVWTGTAESPQLGLVDARYYHGFEPDQVVADGFRAPLSRHNYYFEGGNFVADARGNCFIVNRGYAEDIPETVFRKNYGCSSLTRLPYVAGIGHADERVKVLSDTLAVTDTQSYVPLLRAKGYTVRMLPKLYPAGGERTYVNSLLVNGTLYLPVYGLATDDEAIRVYEDAGFRVVPLESRGLSDNGKGSIHCITMTYPPAEFRP